MKLSFEKICVLCITIIGFIVAFAFAICIAIANENNYKKIELKIEPIPETKIINEIEIAQEEINIYDAICEKYANEMSILFQNQNPTEEWYDNYIAVLDKYGDVIERPDELYDEFSDDEIKWLFKAVETEVHGGDFESKVNVANVILNRLNSDYFPDSLEKVVKQPNQLCYSQKYIMSDTVKACEYAYAFEDTTNGALFFKASYSDKWNGRNFIFEDNVGHCFY